METIKGRKFKQIGEGVESAVFSHERRVADGLSREGKTVVKNFEGLDGIDENSKNELQTLFQTYKRIYGADLFPRQRFVADKKRLGKYFLVQEKIFIQEPDSIFDYDEKTLSETVKRRLEILVGSLKESYLRANDPKYPQKNPKDNAPLDLNDGNLVITVDNKLKHVDTGLLMTNYQEMDNSMVEERIAARIAALECVLGRDPAEFLSDDFYDDFLAYCHVSKHPSSKWDKDMWRKDKAKQIFLKVGRLIAADNEKKLGGKL